MTANARSRRRWLGVLCLLAAMVMLVLGLTVIEARLSGVGLIAYWLGCFVLTALAAGVALLDAARVQAENRAEQRALIESTLHEIERQKQSREIGKS